MRAKIGFIPQPGGVFVGVGRVGRAWARNLTKSGFIGGMQDAMQMYLGP